MIREQYADMWDSLRCFLKKSSFVQEKLGRDPNITYVSIKDILVKMHEIEQKMLDEYCKNIRTIDIGVEIKGFNDDDEVVILKNS